MYLNKALIAGNLTRDPELRSLPSGQKVASFSVATNRFWKDQSGQRQQATDYHNIVVFGPQGENTAKYLTKGSQVLIEGRIQTRSWEGQDGKKNYRTEIVADRVQFGQKGSGSDTGKNFADNKENLKSEENQQEPAIPSVEYPDDDINPEDIPF